MKPIVFQGTAKLSHQLILRRKELSVGQQDYLNMEAVLDALGPDIQRLNAQTTLGYHSKSNGERFDSFKLSWSLSHLMNIAPSNQLYTEEAQLPFQMGQALTDESEFSRLVNYFIATGQRIQPFSQDMAVLPTNVSLHPNLIQLAIANNVKQYRQQLQLGDFGVLPAVQYLHDVQEVLKRQKNQWELLPKSVHIVIDAIGSGVRGETSNTSADSDLTPSIAPKLLDIKNKLLQKHQSALSILCSNQQDHKYSGFHDEKMIFNLIYIQFKDRNGEDVKLSLGKMPVGIAHQGYTAKEQQEILPIETIDAFYKACFENALQWVRVLKPEGWQTVSEPLGNKDV